MSLFYINLDYESDVRFDLAKFMEYSEDVYEPLTSDFLYEIEKLTPVDRFTVTSEEGRPDLISYKIYGTTQYWWVLMEMNGILDIENIVNGTIIEYPDISDLENIYFSLKSKEVLKK